MYYDLIGLPPTPEETAAFLSAADGNPRTALESVVDRLLNSPHYGERWGRHWLDLARYADSFGFEQDTDRHHAYHYRDFVIKALNNDMGLHESCRLLIHTGTNSLELVKAHVQDLENLNVLQQLLFPTG